MTGEYVGVNIDLQVREIIAAANGSGVDGILSTHNLSALLDGDSLIYFWREIERQFDIAVTRAQRATLRTVGDVVRYLKLRKKMEAPVIAAKVAHTSRLARIGESWAKAQTEAHG